MATTRTPRPAETSHSSPGERTPLLDPENNNSTAQDANGVAKHQAGDSRSHPDTQDDEVPLAEEPSTTKLLVILCSIWLGVFLAALDGTVVATLAGPISGYFESGELFSWLASAYLIANAALQPLSGKLTDIYGRRAGLIWSNIFFLAGNAICGLAERQWVMITGRVIAGIGGGCLNTISTFVTSDLVPLRQRGLWQGIGNIAFGAGSGLGGIFGGYINDTWSWRWAFLIQAPFVVVSGLIVFFTVKIPVKETNSARIKRVDFTGSFLLVLSLVLLLLGLNSGGNIVPWSHPLVYVSLPLSVLLLALFVYQEDRRAHEPVIPVRLLLNRTVTSACLANWFTTMAYFAFLIYAPVYLEARGMTPTAAGVRLVSSSVGSSIGSLGTGIIMRATGRYYILTVVILAILTASMSVQVAVLDENTPTWPPFVIFFFHGIGYGGMLTITLVALISAVDHKDQAVVTSASYAFRSTGSTIGIAAASAVFQNRLKTRLWQEFAGRKDAAEIVRELRDSIGAIKNLPDHLRLEAIVAYVDASKAVWIAALTLCAVGAISGLFMREHTLFSNLARK
ncbi:MAG: hypothetical protein M1831_001391 [Alyxoria varia]|nr:MAG: hypothetical protein M1831_001391 [Alyxoria varia]